MTDYMKKFSCKGKKAVVVGGAGLIGQEVVRALAQAGATVILADVDELKGITFVRKLKTAGKVKFVHFDITDLNHLAFNIDSIVNAYGSIDIWVNTAYPRTSDWGARDESVSVESWRKNVDLQLNSYGLSSKYVAGHMKKKGGSIINVGSIYGVVGPDFNVYEGTTMGNSLIYAAVKGGVASLGRYLASYWGKHKIRVNTVCPGGVFNHQNPTFVKNYSKKVPLGRMAEASEIASAVLFLASDAASYISGTSFMVDGGWTTI
jgi:NAD(P)-dependent dehydrogenase (short-subunit alcohol dehydrogenase family)